MKEGANETLARTHVEYSRLRLHDALAIWHAEAEPTRANFERLIRRQADLKRAIAVEGRPQPKEQE